MESRFKLLKRNGNDESGNPVYSSTDISEPIGFDGFTSKLVRSIRHGISAEFSDTDLEFDCTASDIIRTSYNSIGVDAEILLIVEQSCDGELWEEVYRGTLDLTTYSDHTAQYKYVKCKTGDIGVMTTFNNRLSDSVLMSATEGADGGDIGQYANLDKEITLPAKKVIISNKASAENITGTCSFLGGDYMAFLAPFGTITINEFYDFIVNDGTNNFGTTISYEGGYDENISIMKKINPILKYTESEINIGTIHIDAMMNTLMEFSDVGMKACLYNTVTEARTFYPVSQSYNYADGAIYTLSLDIAPLKENEEFFLYVLVSHVVTEFTVKNAYLNITALSTYKDSNCNVSMLHETLSHISEYISNGQLTVKSDWYGRPDSEVNATSSHGGGSMRCLTNGLKIRNAKLTDGSDGYFSITMKDLYDSLNAIDNIGMGFSKENGVLYVRIEPWSWFYKSDTVLTINNPASKVREVDAENIYSRLIIGYKKYTDIEDANGLDAFHTQREYSTKVKAVDNQMELLSKLVADPYVIEYTRRKAIDKDTEDWKYDDEVFIICLKAEHFLLGGDDYMVDVSVSDSDNTIISPETIYNARISPARNAMRWADRMLSFKGATSLYLSTAIGNANAKSRAYNKTRIDEGYPPIIHLYVYGYDVGTIVIENQTISATTHILKPEKISFEWPLTPSQYKTLKENPYNKIVLDGEDCYLSEVEYEYKGGIAKFVVIPKY